jgi:hypothetical protein
MQGTIQQEGRLTETEDILKKYQVTGAAYR